MNNEKLTVMKTFLQDTEHLPLDARMGMLMFMQLFLIDTHTEDPVGAVDALADGLRSMAREGTATRLDCLIHQYRTLVH